MMVWFFCRRTAPIFIEFSTVSALYSRRWEITSEGLAFSIEATEKSAWETAIVSCFVGSCNQKIGSFFLSIYPACKWRGDFCCLFRFETAAGIRNPIWLARATSRHFSHSDILARCCLTINCGEFTLFGSLTQRQD